MPLALPHDRPIILIRREAFERTALTRADLDARYTLMPDEFRVEGALIAVGPLVGDDALIGLVEELEAAGLRHFEDFFDLSGTWPQWLRLFAMAGGDAEA